MSQPVSGANKVSVQGGVGTSLVTDGPCVLNRVFWGGTYVGTLIIHDAPSVTGTTTTSAVLTLGLPLTRYPNHLDMGIQMRKGIVYQATGTPVATIVWE